MLEIIDTFLEHLDVGAMRIIYSDTGKQCQSDFKSDLISDSLFLCLSRPIEKLAKAGHEEIWKKIYPTIFCADENDPDLKREPGLLKVSSNINISINLSFLDGVFYN